MERARKRVGGRGYDDESLKVKWENKNRNKKMWSYSAR